MKVICIINLKGGVAKTISAINIAHILATKHGKQVLLIDNDKQGNTSKFFGLHSYENLSFADVLTSKDPDTILKAIKITEYNDYESGYYLHVLPANMNLLHADRQILIDTGRPQQTRLKKALQVLIDTNASYDYVVIDNAPDLNMSVVNAIVAANDILIPIKVDKFAFDGLDQLLEQVEELREFNPNLRIAGGFITMYSKNNVNIQGVEVLGEKKGLPMFETVIRNTVKVNETTYTGEPITAYAPKSTAAKDYDALVDEYLRVSERAKDARSARYVSETITK